jgi:hypothetical protein
MPIKKTKLTNGTKTKKTDEFGVISSGEEVVLKLPIPPKRQPLLEKLQWQGSRVL